MTPAPIEDRRLAAIGLMVAAYAAFTGIDACAKWLAQAGMPVQQIGCVRFAVHAALALAVFLPVEGPAMVRARRPGAVALRAACLLAGTVFNFIAVRHLPLSLTATIFFLSPLVICALSVPMLGERVGPRRWAAIGVGFVGVLIATRPWGAEAHWAILCSLGGCLSASLYAILTRRLAGVDSSATQQLWASALPALALAPLAAPVWALPATPDAWLALSLIGAFGFLGHQVLTRAHRLAPATVLAPFVYVHLLFMTLAGWLVFAEAPDGWVLAGGALVAASGLYVWDRERRLAKSI